MFAQRRRHTRLAEGRDGCADSMRGRAKLTAAIGPPLSQALECVARGCKHCDLERAHLYVEIRVSSLFPSFLPSWLSPSFVPRRSSCLTTTLVVHLVASQRKCQREEGQLSPDAFSVADIVVYSRAFPPGSRFSRPAENDASKVREDEASTDAARRRLPAALSRRSLDSRWVLTVQIHLTVSRTSGQHLLHLSLPVS